MLLTYRPPPLPLDCNNISYAQCKADIPATLVDANNLLFYSVSTNMQVDPNNVRRLMCQNVGNILIEWTDNTKSAAPPYSLVWWGFNNPVRPANNFFADAINESMSPPYKAQWTPTTPRQYWPKALKFTFTLYDSKNVLRTGQTFTHIVSLDN
jgi:hypothetical protein